jgi:hypothetical protein
MSVRDPNPLDPLHPKRAAIVLSNPVWQVGALLRGMHQHAKNQDPG